MKPCTKINEKKNIRLVIGKGYKLDGNNKMYYINRKKLLNDKFATPNLNHLNRDN